MAILTEASHQWTTRPADQRFLSLPEMAEAMLGLRNRSPASIERVADMEVLTDDADAAERGLLIGIGNTAFAPTHHSFGQLCSVASRGSNPVWYFRQNPLPAGLIAAALNCSLRSHRGAVEAGVLTADTELRAVTGPRYGRVWNAEIVDMLIDRFGDGVTGVWRVPGELGKQVAVNRENTTLYASDRDMFVFLADEERRIEVPGRRGSRSGSLARGFFIWNSEVGDKMLGAGFFLFDYVCANRIVWGAEQYSEVRIRHTAGALNRWLNQVFPILTDFARSGPTTVEEAVKRARGKKVENLFSFLTERFGRETAVAIKTTHEEEEGRPIETVWDVTVAATAYARSLPNTDRRISVERIAGDLSRMAA